MNSDTLHFIIIYNYNIIFYFFNIYLIVNHQLNWLLLAFSTEESIMKKLLALLLVIILSLSFLIFHNKGNELLKPYLSSYIESQIDQNITIKVQDLKIDAKNIQFTTIINKTTILQAKGEFSLFSRMLDLNYMINSDGFKSKGIFLDTKTALIGTVKGNFDNMNIKGEAKDDTFESKLTYQFQRK